MEQFVGSLVKSSIRGKFREIDEVGNDQTLQRR